jgi:hypothetical protein
MKDKKKKNVTTIVVFASPSTRILVVSLILQSGIIIL